MKASLIWSMPSVGVFLVYTEPSTMRIGEAGFEQFSNVISFRVADAIFPPRMHFFCHGKMLLKTLLMAKKLREVCFISPQTLWSHFTLLGYEKAKNRLLACGHNDAHPISEVRNSVAEGDLQNHVKCFYTTHFIRPCIIT